MRARYLLLLALVGGLGGCANQALRQITFHPSAQANEGRPFYLLVRTATEKDFFTDDYQKIGGMVFPPSEDPSVLAAELVWPGQPKQVKVKVPDKKSFAIYVLYTSPREPWKVLVGPPLKKDYSFVLDRGRITPGPVGKRP